MRPSPELACRAAAISSRSPLQAHHEFSLVLLAGEPEAERFVKASRTGVRRHRAGPRRRGSELAPVLEPPLHRAPADAAAPVALRDHEPPQEVALSRIVEGEDEADR